MAKIKERSFIKRFYDNLPLHWREYIDLRGGFLLEHFRSFVSVQFEDGSNCFFNYAFLVVDEDRQELAVFTEHSGYHVFPSNGTNWHTLLHTESKKLVSTEDAVRVSHLARLDMVEGSATEMAGKLNQVLGYVDRLEDIDTEGVEPLAHALDLSNVFREDEPRPSLTPDEALSNAPKRVGDYFAVPPVFEEHVDGVQDTEGVLPGADGRPQGRGDGGQPGAVDPSGGSPAGLPEPNL